LGLGTFDAQTIDEMKQHNMKLRKAARELRKHVNDNGGWTVIGWHHRGLMTTGQDGAQELSSDTKGHLVRLEPTNCTGSFFNDLNDYRFTMD
jgi:predicted Rossmann-fold nucleotide-binding protein